MLGYKTSVALHNVANLKSKYSHRTGLSVNIKLMLLKLGDTSCVQICVSDMRTTYKDILMSYHNFNYFNGISCYLNYLNETSCHFKDMLWP